MQTRSHLLHTHTSCCGVCNYSVLFTYVGLTTGQVERHALVHHPQSAVPGRHDPSQHVHRHRHSHPLPLLLISTPHLFFSSISSPHLESPCQATLRPKPRRVRGIRSSYTRVTCGLSVSPLSSWTSHSLCRQSPSQCLRKSSQIATTLPQPQAKAL